MSEKIILGIDPGTVVMGYGVISVTKGKIMLLQAGAIKLGKYEDHYLRLQKIFERTLGVIDSCHPDEIALEAPFFGKNVQSMLKLGRAQGVAMAAALSRNIPIVEYAPRKIKQSVTGNGNASKDMVAKVLSKMLGFTENPQYLDATDGLAVAVCHYNESQNNSLMPVPTKGKKVSWEAFVKANPEKIK